MAQQSTASPVAPRIALHEVLAAPAGKGLPRRRLISDRGLGLLIAAGFSALVWVAMLWAAAQAIGAISTLG